MATHLPCRLSLGVAQIHVHWVGDGIQPYHPLPPFSTFAFTLSKHQGLFQWVGSLHQVAKVLGLQLQSFQWIFRVRFIYDWSVWSPCSPRDSQESSPAPQFFPSTSWAMPCVTHILGPRFMGKPTYTLSLVTSAEGRESSREYSANINSQPRSDLHRFCSQLTGQHGSSRIARLPRVRNHYPCMCPEADSSQ